MRDNTNSRKGRDGRTATGSTNRAGSSTNKGRSSSSARPDSRSSSSTGRSFSSSKTASETRGERSFDRDAKPRSAGYSKTTSSSERPYSSSKPASERGGERKFEGNRPKSSGSGRPYADKPYATGKPSADRYEKTSSSDRPRSKGPYTAPGADRAERTFDSNRPNARPYAKKSSDKPFSATKPTVTKKFLNREASQGTVKDKPWLKTRLVKEKKEVVIITPDGFERKARVKTAKEKRGRIDNSDVTGAPTLSTSKEAKPLVKNPLEAPSYDFGKFKALEEKQNKFRKEKIGVKNEDGIRLNRFIANAGICSRRDADLLIEAGEITVNGSVVTEMGYKVQPTDTIKYGDRTLKREKMTYVLLNKPKDFITTTRDPQERKTVMQLVANVGNERIYPVGRLDRNTTGILLLTNDGELSQKLAHPSTNIRKIYEVQLDKPMSREDFETLQNGVTLEDGFVKPDEVAHIDEKFGILGIEIHSGKNRIVRRMFEHFGYEVVRLDRVMYASLTKKDLPRGHWRHLTEKEVIQLKYFS
ncbi:MAG: hypothetical protein RLZZ175_1534 [Bacteroidota bacterium]|jgi:23S rRNA pseudouridine2605 synthase